MVRVKIAFKHFPKMILPAWKHAAISLASASTLFLASGCSVADRFSGNSSGSTTDTPRDLQFVDAPSVNLGNVPVNATRLIILPISSTGAGSATISSFSNSDSKFTFNGGTFPGAGGTCSQPIQGNCSVAILFTAPTSAAGVGFYNDTLSIAYTSGGASKAITLTISATVAVAANIVINSGASYDYGSKNLGSTTSQSLTVWNTGLLNASSITPASLASPFNYKGGTYPGTGGNCSTLLSAASSCTIVVDYVPSVAGAASKSLALNYSDGNAPASASMTLLGNGLSYASLSITNPIASPYDFGSQATTAAETSATFTLTNSGQQTATALSGSSLVSPFSYKGGTYPGTGGTCGSTLAPATSCTLVLAFLPTTVGVANATLSISANTGEMVRTITQTLRGTGVGPANLTISNGPTCDYGTKLVGTNNDFSFTVTNSGGSPATSIVGSGLSAPFTFKGGSYPGTGGTCGTTIAVSASCTMIVRYSPTAAVTLTSTPTLTYNDGGASKTGSITVSGTGYLQAILSISLPAVNPYDFGTKTAGAAETDVTFTVANTGNGAASSLAATGIATPFLYKGGSYPGTGGTCSTSLAASSTCTIIFGFLPVTPGSYTGTLTVSANDGLGAVNATKGYSAIVAGPAVLTITNTPTYDYGSKLVGTTTDQTITVTNTGGSTATSLAGSGLSAPITYTGGTYPGTGGTCATTLASNASCTIVVRFTPTTAGASTKTLSLAYNDGGVAQSKTIGFTGTGFVQAILAYTTPSGNPYDLGTKAVGAAETDITVTVSNTGNGPASSLSATGLVAPYLYKGGSYPGTGGTCGTTLAASTTCTMIIGYLPTTSGSFTATLSLAANDGVSTVTITKGFSGIAITPASLTISDSPLYDYGNRVVGTTTDHSFTVLNNGGSTATALAVTGLSAPLNYKGGTYPGTGGTCATTLAASSSCTIIARFAPTTAGSFGVTMILGYSDGTATTSASTMLSGVAYLQAMLAVHTPVADPYSFGAQTVGAAATSTTFTITNNGNGPATSIGETTLSSPYGYVGGTYPGTGGTCGATLAASGTCTLKIEFLPTSTGTFNGTSTLNYADGSGSTVNLTHGVTGTAGTSAVLSISDGPTYDFGSLTAGTTADQSFVVTNSGGASASSLSASALTSPFTFKGGTFPGTGGSCGTTLGAGATCTVVVRFAPSASGSFSTSFVLNYNDSVTTATTNRPIVGTGGSVANLTISDGATYDFGVVSKSYSLDHSFTVSNVGGASATSLSATALSAPFSFKDGTFPGTGGTCGTTLGAGGTCTIVVSFSPTATGAASGTLSLSYDNTSTTVSATRAMTALGAVITKIVGGAEHTCGLYNSGAVRCWGSNASGQLGNTSAGSGSPTPVAVTGVTTAVDIAAGSYHTCVVLSNGRAQCWGSDSSGQLGNDVTLANAASPAYVATYSDFTHISAGGELTCAVRSGGTITCWGDDSQGGNGNDTSTIAADYTDNPTPVTVYNLTGMQSVSVGTNTACGVKSDGTLRCWGSDTSGALGSSAVTTVSGTPQTPNGSGSANVSTVNGGYSSCSLQNSDTVRCWGANDVGQLGDGNAPTNRTTGATITNLSTKGFSQIVLGTKHGCALNGSGAVKCWGGGSYGQIGNSGTGNQSTPTTVTGISTGASVVGTGETHTCAILSTGAGYCWGANSSGQLGSTPLTQQSTPVLVPGI